MILMDFTLFFRVNMGPVIDGLERNNSVGRKTSQEDTEVIQGRNKGV